MAALGTVPHPVQTAVLQVARTAGGGVNGAGELVRQARWRGVARRTPRRERSVAAGATAVGGGGAWRQRRPRRMHAEGEAMRKRGGGGIGMLLSRQHPDSHYCRCRVGSVQSEGWGARGLF